MPAECIDPKTLPGSGRIVVAFSGGPDSVCLLHRLVRSDLDRRLFCVHVDHGLDAESGERAGRAVALAHRLGVDCEVVRVHVEATHGPEASARRARYLALEARMVADDLLVTAHHADDQVETVLLRLVRGAGPEGLAGIPAARRFGPGWLARPLLDWTRSDIERWLVRHGLDCIRDPANECPDFDRNFLRQEALPALRQRWPGIDAALRRSARLCRGAAEFTAARVDHDLENAETRIGTLHLDRLAADSDYYRGAAIRAWCIARQVDPPPGRRLDAFVEQLSSAAPDRCPQLRWDESVLRCWRSQLWLQRGEDAPAGWRLDWDGHRPMTLPAGLGVLKLTGPAGPALALRIGAGQPGDALKPAGQAHRRECKRLLAEAGVPPWQRNQWPRLWLDDRIAALGTRWRSAAFDALLAERGQSLVWEPGPRRLNATELELRS